MHKWNRALAAVLSAALVFTSTPAGVMAADLNEADASGAVATGELAAGTSEEDAEAAPEESAEDNSAEQNERNEADETGAQEESVEEEAAADVEDSADGSAADAADEADVEEQDEYAEEASGEATEEDADEFATEAAPVLEEEPEGETAEKSSADASAEDEEIQEVPEYVGELVELDLGDSDALYEEYANRMFYGNSSDNGRKKLKSVAGSNLTGLNKEIYEVLKAGLKKVADGESDSSIVRVSGVNWNLEPEYQASDLGVSIDDANALYEAIKQKAGYDMNKIIKALIADCAYELYWSGGSYSIGMGGLGHSGTTVYTSDYYIEIKTIVDEKFRQAGGNKYSVDTAQTGTVKTAVETAKKIVANAAGKTDYYKLDYYKERICDLVVYNDEAAADSSSYTDRGPWALVYVFDGLDQTNVVCEGYAEAFQYLTELTEFSGDTYAYSVSGVMSGGTGAGNHKWNIVHIDGANYLVDVTNSDAGSVGQFGDLFMKGVSGSVRGGYTRSWPERQQRIDYEDGSYSIRTIGGATINYKYDSDTLIVYTEEELTLSPTDYGVADPSTTDDKANLKGISIYLSDRIGMQIYVKTNAAVAGTDFMEFSYVGKTVTQPVSDADKKTITDFNGESIEVLVFELPLWSTEMTEEVSFRMSIGGVYGTPKTYSVREYADELLRGDQYEDKYKDMARVMLNYGGYSQEYFGYNMDKLANKDLYEEGQNPVPASTPDLSQFDYTFTVASDTQGFNLKQVSLGLGDRIELKFYYTLDSGKTLSDYEFVPLGDYTLDFNYEEDKGMDCVIIGGIKPFDINDYYGFTTKSKNGEQLVSIDYCPLAYCKAKIERATSSEKIKNLCKALYAYWSEATRLYH